MGEYVTQQYAFIPSQYVQQQPQQLQPQYQKPDTHWMDYAQQAEQQRQLREQQQQQQQQNHPGNIQRFKEVRSTENLPGRPYVNNNNNNHTITNFSKSYPGPQQTNMNTSLQTQSVPPPYTYNCPGLQQPQVYYVAYPVASPINEQNTSQNYQKPLPSAPAFDASRNIRSRSDPNEPVQRTATVSNTEQRGRSASIPTTVVLDESNLLLEAECSAMNGKEVITGKGNIFRTHFNFIWKHDKKKTVVKIPFDTVLYVQSQTKNNKPAVELHTKDNQVHTFFDFKRVKHQKVHDMLSRLINGESSSPSRHYGLSNSAGVTMVTTTPAGNNNLMTNLKKASSVSKHIFLGK